MPRDFNERPHQNEKNEALGYVRTLIDQARLDGRNEEVAHLEKILKLLNIFIDFFSRPLQYRLLTIFES